MSSPEVNRWFSVQCFACHCLSFFFQPMRCLSIDLRLLVTLFEIFQHFSYVSPLCSYVTVLSHVLHIYFVTVLPLLGPGFLTISFETLIMKNHMDCQYCPRNGTQEVTCNLSKRTTSIIRQIYTISLKYRKLEV